MCVLCEREEKREEISAGVFFFVCLFSSSVGWIVCYAWTRGENVE